MNYLKFLIIGSVALVSSFAYSVSAFEATSTSFEIHAGDTESVVGASTSTTFKLHYAGGQNATASSSLTITSISSGILYWLYGFFGALYEQTHYRWRNDDGTNETDATWGPNEDILYNQLQKNTVKRLRIEVSNEGWTRGSAPQFRLEVASTTVCASGSYVAVPTDYSGTWHLATSTVVSDATATSDFAGSLTNSNGNFVPGQIKTTGNTTSAIALTSTDFTEIEYGLLATSNAVNGGTYCFRVTNNGSTSNMGYSESKYPKAVIASGLSATGSLESAVFETTATAGHGVAYNSIMWKGSQNGSLGKVQFQFATSDCSNGKTNYPACNDTGVWTFYGNQGGTCNTNNYYDTTSADVPVELSCSPSYHNNQRYFRYKIQICSSNCTDSGVASPIVEDVVVNWAP